jgi:hypothetical protein
VITWLRYLGMAAVVVALVAIGAMVFLEGSREHGLLWAAGVALAVQAGAFGLLLRYRGRPQGFLAAWLAGMMARLLALGGVALMVIRRDDVDPLWTLLGIAGLFFVLHLLEPLALRGAGPEPRTGIETG